MLKGTWNYPSHIEAGADSIHTVVDHCLALGIRRPLVVTDPGLSQFEFITGLISSLNNSELNATLFADIQANPSGENVNQGIAVLTNNRCDGVIGIGGGSSLDAAKAIALVAYQSRSLWDFEDIGDNWKRVQVDKVLPCIAVPTTAGTGSEVGRASVITNTEKRVKTIIFHPEMLPKVVILDPMLCLQLPAPLTAATGMDALSHSLEALCSPNYHPMAEAIALEGIRLVADYLPRAYSNGQDLDARMQMLVASSMGATAFQKGLGAMHALAHSLGALHNAHHGMLNAVLMPYVLAANQAQIHHKMQRLARQLNLAEQSTQAVLEWVLSLRASLGIPHTLLEMGIDGSDSELVAQMSVNDSAAGSNPILFSSAQYQQLYLDAVNGDLRL